MNSSKGLMKKNVLVTGGGRGLGQAIVDRFVREGNFTVFSTFHGSKQSDLRDDVDWLFCDFSDPDGVEALCQSLG